MADPKPLSKSLTIEETLRFWSFIDRDHPHWKWSGAIVGRLRTPVFCVHGRKYSARRLTWELVKRGKPLPKSKKLFSTCGVKHCLNPEHMSFEKPPQKKCLRGHLLTEKNVYVTTQGKRTCRKCMKATIARRKKRYLKEGRGWGRDYVRLSEKPR